MNMTTILLAMLLSLSGLASATPAPLTFCTGGEGGFY